MAAQLKQTTKTDTKTETKAPKAPKPYKQRFNAIAVRLARQNASLQRLARSRSKPTDDERAKAIAWYMAQYRATLAALEGAPTTDENGVL